ncbi:class I SAM-dependent methyltransferase [Falsiroseomonas sp. HW251]|uniref:class I SAM-dependent methyltransferase n=1 Tax=Falsiroseomonas sp. HW251 TaxID=3390998 RepID=UPI003D31EADF
MHDTALAAGTIFFERYGTAPGITIVEVGARDVGVGALRQAAPSTAARYIGLDLEAGPNVDLVLDDPHRFPLADGAADLVVSSSCMEHDALFWLTFLEMARITRPGGHIYVNAPSNGAVHRYPLDCWRFYPDSGRALQTWSERQGLPVLLLEAMLLPRRRDIWNDCVMVFRREPGPERALPQSPLADAFPDATNVLLHGAAAPRNPQAYTEDMAIIRDLARRLRQLMAQQQQ